MAGNELNVLAVAVLGGASLIGGIGTVGGVLLGILLLAMLQNGLNLLGVSPYFFQIVIGLVDPGLDLDHRPQLAPRPPPPRPARRPPMAEPRPADRPASAA